MYLKTGLRVAGIGTKTHFKNVRWPSEITPDGFVPDPDLPHEFTLKRNNWFVELPIIGRLELSNRKLHCFVEGGISPHIYLITWQNISPSVDTESSFQRISAKGFNDLQFVASISAGANYSLSNRFQVFVQPIFRYHLTRLVEAQVKENLYSMGLEFGIRRKL